MQWEDVRHWELGQSSKLHMQKRAKKQVGRYGLKMSLGAVLLTSVGLKFFKIKLDGEKFTDLHK